MSLPFITGSVARTCSADFRAGKRMLSELSGKNRAGVPKDVENVKLKKGETACRVSTAGLMTLVWRDKKDVRILSTFHRSDMVDTGRENRNGNRRSVHKSMKWYKNVFL